MTGRGNNIFYLHESGRREQQQPIPDKVLLDGWTKLTRNFVRALSRVLEEVKKNETELTTGIGWAGWAGGGRAWDDNAIASSLYIATSASGSYASA
jgi:hypothetical protein